MSEERFKNNGHKTIDELVNEARAAAKQSGEKQGGCLPIVLWMLVAVRTLTQGQNGFLPQITLFDSKAQNPHSIVIPHP